MSKAIFTQRHYNKIHALIKSSLETHEDEESGFSVWNDVDSGYSAGLRIMHDRLGAMFQEDNPNFKPELWKL